jgi:hypothetical protein
VGKMKRALVSMCLSVAVAGLSVAGAAPASAGLSPTRTCANFDATNNRRLSVCVHYWLNDPPLQSRGVVEMHTYILVNGHPIDSTSQSITVNAANFNLFGNGWDSDHFLGSLRYGNDVSSTTCRVNGPSSPTIACSIPNAVRVAYYSTAFNGAALRFENCVSKVSWRDDLGQAHIVNTSLCYFDPPL